MSQGGPKFASVSTTWAQIFRVKPCLPSSCYDLNNGKAVEELNRARRRPAIQLQPVARDFEGEDGRLRLSVSLSQCRMVCWLARSSAGIIEGRVVGPDDLKSEDEAGYDSSIGVAAATKESIREGFKGCGDSAGTEGSSADRKRFFCCDAGR